MPGTDDANEYRRCALECVEMANAMDNPAHRVVLLQMAQAWMRLAENADKKPSGLIRRIFTSRNPTAPSSGSE
jgi:hypothetical protein